MKIGIIRMIILVSSIWLMLQSDHAPSFPLYIAALSRHSKPSVRWSTSMHLALFSTIWFNSLVLSGK
uniref:Uncharacterized protein n=1 Tax=Arundo donax TaxID=35708 RepID=A0A0A8ZUE6_ARUDO